MDPKKNMIVSIEVTDPELLSQVYDWDRLEQFKRELTTMFNLAGIRDIRWPKIDDGIKVDPLERWRRELTANLNSANGQSVLNVSNCNIKVTKLHCIGFAPPKQYNPKRFEVLAYKFGKADSSVFSGNNRLYLNPTDINGGNVVKFQLTTQEPK